MRPTVTEQLRRTAQTLREGVAPHVGDLEARRVTQSAIAGLDVLVEAWPRVLPFLVWDNAETTRLLQERDVQVIAFDGDPLDIDANEQRNEYLRELLETHVLDPSREVDTDIMEHLDQRARRYPLRYIPRLNTGTD